MGTEWNESWPSDEPPRLRELRRVVPVARTLTIGGAIITLFSLDDYAEGFALRLRMLLADDHPVTAAARKQQAEFWRPRTEAAFAEDEATTNRAEDEWSMLAPELELVVHDDRCQSYQPTYGGSANWGSDLEAWTEAHYIPALDPAARELRARVERVDWRSYQFRREGPVVLVNQGPWVFAVPL